MARAKPELFLHEQVLLLALRDEKGTIERKAGMYEFAVGGAILSELLLAGCVAIGGDKKKLVDPVRKKRLYDPVLDEAMEKVASARRRRSATSWVTRFARIKKLRHRVAERLCHRGILKDSSDRVLLFFTRKVYPTIDPGPERRMVERIRKAVFEDTSRPDSRTLILVALANGAGLLGVHFDRKSLKGRKKRLEAITSGDVAGGATRAAVQAAQAAIAAAAAASAAATVAATASR